MNEDVKQFPLLTDGERNAFDKIISFLNFLDSIQSENLPNLTRYVTAPEISSLLNIQAFQEEIHAQSYSYILDTVTNPVTRDKIYDEWREDKNLLKRNRYIANIYQKFNEEPTSERFYQGGDCKLYTGRHLFLLRLQLFLYLSKTGKNDSDQHYI